MLLVFNILLHAMLTQSPFLFNSHLLFSTLNSTLTFATTLSLNFNALEQSYAFQCLCIPTALHHSHSTTIMHNLPNLTC